MCYTNKVDSDVSTGLGFQGPGACVPTPRGNTMDNAPAPTVLQKLNQLESTRNRRTTEERAAHLEQMKNWLDMGLTKPTVTAFARSEFGISRTRAYADFDYAEAERSAERNDNEPQEITLADRDALMRMITVMCVKAFQGQDVNGFARLTREYERLARMGGHNFGKP